MTQSESTLETKMLNFETFKPKLGDWADKFRPFIETEAMWNIMQRIKQDSLTEVVVPKSSDTFRAFSTTKPEDLKVIFYLMDPYPRKYKEGGLQATGIAMDCTNTPDGKLQPSLDVFYDALELEMSHKVKRSPDLTYLHEQGVMMLNSDLTCKLNKTQSHEKLWEPFQEYFLDHILRSDTQIIYVLCGKASHRMERFISPYCTIFKLSHPAFAFRSGQAWDSEGVFTKINKLLKEKNNNHVFWDKDDWDAYKECPF